MLCVCLVVPLIGGKEDEWLTADAVYLSQASSRDKI